MASPDHDLDEYGLPVAWRLDEVDSALIEDAEEYWAGFEDWCRRKGYSAFPATPTTVLRFLDDQSRGRANLKDVWTAIDLRHEAYYWHSNANPVPILEDSGVVVGEDGAVTIPPGVREYFR